jgi:hypothetical protein
MLLAGGRLIGAAQRLDGCPGDSEPSVQSLSQPPISEASDRGLQNLGYSQTRESLKSALEGSQIQVSAASDLAEGAVGCC